MLNTLFEAIDRKDVATFGSLLAPQCEFCFGNLPAVQGRAAIEAFVSGFFASIAALSHVIENRWEVPGGLVCHGTVTYTRHDASTLIVPFANVFALDAAGISRYRIYIDNSALYAH
jgi:hypothetical protein